MHLMVFKLNLNSKIHAVKGYIQGVTKSNAKSGNNYFMASIILLKIVQNL